MADDPPGLVPAFVHETAVIDENVRLGPGTKVWHFTHVSAGAAIGAGTVLGQGVYVGPGVVIGAGCRIQNHVSVYSGVTLGDRVFVGPSAVFTNVLTPRAHVSRKDEFRPTVVEAGATIGANATVVCGVRLAERAFVAAGAVVTHDVGPGVLVRGVPARPAGFACACGDVLGEPEAGPAAVYRCGRCGASWVATADSSGVERREDR
ncbi:MAG: acyltransferase [Planctomycetota bacterium]